MAHVAIGIPAKLSTRVVSNRDGDFKRGEFQLADPMLSGDRYPDIFEVGAKGIDVVEEAFDEQRQVRLVAGFSRNTAKKDEDPHWVIEVTEVEPVE